jgi:hypothetical protein
MPEEPASSHASRHDRPNAAGHRAQRAGIRSRAVLLLDDVLVVAGEQLVAAVAGQHDFDVLGRQLRHHVGRDRRRIAEWLVEIPGQVFDDLHRVRLITRSRGDRSGTAAPRRGERSSSNCDSAKPIENVLQRRPLGLDISATTALESMPPLRNAPTGTSLIWCSGPIRPARSAAARRARLRSPSRSAELDVPVLLDPQRAGSSATRRRSGRLELRDTFDDAAGAGVERNVKSDAPRPSRSRGTCGQLQDRLQLGREDAARCRARRR